MNTIRKVALFAAEMGFLAVMLTIVQPKDHDVDVMFRIGGVVVIVVGLGIVFLLKPKV